MRSFITLTFLALFLTPFSLQAGQISSAGEKGQWTSTDCKAPAAPATLDKNPETKANDLNAEVAAHNTFAAEAKVYMDCLTNEAERDAKAMSQLIIDQASDKLQQISVEVQKSGDALRAKQQDK